MSRKALKERVLKAIDERAEEIIGSFEPSIPPGEYTEFMRKLVR